MDEIKTYMGGEAFKRISLDQISTIKQKMHSSDPKKYKTIVFGAPCSNLQAIE